MTFSDKVVKMKDIIKNARLQLIAKGETVTYDDDIPDVIENMSTGGGADTGYLKAIIERSSNAEIVIPEGTTLIGQAAFYGFHGLKKITISDSVTGVAPMSFYNSDVETVIIGQNSAIGYIDDNAFYGTRIISFHTPHGCTYIGRNTFANCDYLTTFFIPNTITTIEDSAFTNDILLEDVTVENGFNANHLKLSYSTKYSVNTIVNILNALADRTGLTAYTVTFGSTNLNKLTADQIAIATNKNWNLV